MIQQTMNTAEEWRISCTVLDKGKPPRPFKTLPPGATLDFVSSDPSIARVVVEPSGLSAVIHSDDVGTATITVTPGGTWANLPPDTAEVTIVNAEPGSLNLTGSAPSPEGDE